MSEEDNTALVQTIYDAFNRGDLQVVLANVAANAEWVSHGPSAVPYYGNFSGRVAEFFQAIGGSITDGGVTIEQCVSSGDTVVTRGRWKATVRGTGAKLDADLIHFFTVRGGKVASWNGYGDTAAVLAAHAGKSAAA